MNSVALLPSFVVRSAHSRRRSPKGSKSAVPGGTAKKEGFGKLKIEPLWQCVEGCGACCKLAKDSSFPAPEEIFTESSDIERFRSLLGEDGWCIHFEKKTRTCSIYQDRPYFCRVEPEVFETLYGIDKKKFNKVACSSCVDTIKAVYGSTSMELDNFNQTARKNAVSNASMEP